MTGRQPRKVTVVRSVGGDRRDIELSPRRARELGISGQPGTPPTVTYLMDGLLAWQEAGDSPGTQCPQCGMSHRELVLRHRAGCAECYRVFSASVDRLLSRRSDGAAVHRGRIPQRLQRYRRLFVEREDLLSRLNLAVEQEDFEVAADLRDQIRQISDDATPAD